jgi:hypothetical protein
VAGFPTRETRPPIIPPRDGSPLFFFFCVKKITQLANNHRATLAKIRGTEKNFELSGNTDPARLH